MFKALVLEKGDDGVSASVREMDDSHLPEGDVTVAVDYSTLNYKDGLVVNGLGGLVKSYPHIPGIDFAGTVEDSRHPGFKPGDAVILTGWHVGERHWGGYATRARVKGDWLVPLPKGMTTKRAMAVGTAGFTAMLAVIALERHGLAPGQGPVLVTGATGGVGSVACAVLAALGHEVAAVTGSMDKTSYLRDLGATEIIERAALAEPSGKPMESERWAGAVDAVGGVTLARLLGQLRRNASAAAVGLAGGAEMTVSVVPFLLRGVNLLGIDSVLCPRDRRLESWDRLSRDLPTDLLDEMITMARLDEIPDLAKRILAGGIDGRVVIDVNA